MKRATGFLALSLAACTGAPAQTANEARPSNGAGVASITAADFRARVGFLADDALRGRDTPSPGLEVAAAYVASEFRRNGLEPAGDDGTYLQRWPFPFRTLDGGRTTVGGPGGAALTYGRDFWAVPGERADATGNAVFISAASDTLRVPRGSLAGRIAVVPIAGSRAEPVGRVANGALQLARLADAAAVVFVLDPAIPVDAIPAIVATQPTETRVRATADRPVVYVAHASAGRLFQGGGADFAGLDGRARAGSIDPADTGVRLQVTVPSTVVDKRPPNTVGILRGSDPALRDTYIVLSAHMDHVGVGRPDASGDSIYNGADDDASGTSAILELAEAFASLPTPPARSIVFLTVSGEEKGLLGSAYYADHPTVPIESVVANINIDMIGRNAPDSAVVIGQDYSSLGPLAARLAESHPELGLKVGPDPWPEQRFFFRSDHFNFARREVPALFFFTGTHEDYHRPSDEVDKLDTDKAARIARLVYHIVESVANDSEPPAWTADGLEEVRRLTRQGR